MATQTVVIKLDDFIDEEQCRKARSRGKFVWGKSGLLIGRDQARCDLPIDCEYASRTHVRVSHMKSDFFVADENSTDGTRLNGNALDPGRKYSLFDGDEIHVGDHIIKFQIPALGRAFDEQEASEDSQAAEPAVVQDSDELELTDYISKLRREKGADRVPAFEAEAESVEEDNGAKQNADMDSVSTRRHQVESQEADEVKTVTVPALGSQSEAESQALFADFVSGLRIEFESLDKRLKDKRAFMRSMGSLLFHAVDGIRKALQTQDRFMDQYRIPGTVLGRSHVNPLYTHNIDTKDALEILLGDSISAIADPIAAVQEATRDFYRHGVAVPSGIDAAIKKIVQTFDWAEIEAQIAKSGGLSAVGPLKKSACWDRYCEEYDRAFDTLDEFDNEYRRAVGAAYSTARNQIAQESNRGNQHGE
ncbi:MAG: type VI secretion system-associated FHA domain protein TagH [Gammaproteobacteria bacterium]